MPESLIRRIDLRGDAAPADYRAVVPRAVFDVDAALEVVRPISEGVRARGVDAIAEYSLRFDGVAPEHLRVPEAALADALAALDPGVQAGLEESIRRLRTTCEAELEPEVVTDLGPGARVTHRFLPIRRVGLYVPGGLAPLVSSVVMNVVPAQVAGVESIALASSPQKEHGGLPEPTILAACALLGVDEVYAVGGAQAIAMFAHGAGECEPVDLVTGPGNIYTVAAKRLLKGVVGIDSEAGPTEIAILADDSADAAYVAADLISQSEHDPAAASVLVTSSERLADDVEAELDKQVFATRHTDRIRTALGGQQSGIVLVDDVEQGLAVVDAYAAEHLEIHTQRAADVAARVRNAGAIFVGPFAPVSLGRLLRRLQPRAPHRGLCLPLVGPLGACLPQGGPRRRLRPRRAGRGGRPRGHARRRGGPPGPRRGRHDPVRSMSPLPLREELRGLKPYGAPQLDVPVRLNVNENPYPPSTAVVADIERAVAEAARGLNRYPDREFVALRESLAAYLGHGIRPEQVWAANGSNEVMLHLLQAFGGPGRLALSFAPTYSMYPEYARDTHTGWEVGHREEDFTLDPDRAVALVRARRPHVVLLPSPNNPTGTALAPEVVSALCEELDEGLLVVDEAYAEFRRAGTPSALELLPRHPNLVVTRTMSKAFALAGARVGYLAAAPEVCDALRVVRLPYHLSAVTQAVARAALRHADELLAAVDDLRAERDGCVDWLRAQGYTVADSDANFALFGRFPDRHAVWQGLLDRGVLVRETGPDGWLRVSVGTGPEMAAFRDALTSVTETTEAAP